MTSTPFETTAAPGFEAPTHEPISQPTESPVGGTADATLAARLGQLVRDVADFPQPGVVFKDITPVLADGAAFGAVIRALAAPFHGSVDVVAGIEARGFILGAATAVALGAGFVPLRKAGKLPGPTLSEAYTLEYGHAALEMHQGAMHQAQRVLLVDDVIATGGTAAAACRLAHASGATVVALTALLELSALQGRHRLGALPVQALMVV